MAHADSVLRVPGISRVTPEFLVALGAIADRSALDIDGVAGVISHESGFRPNAKNPVGTATGLIQFIESTARSLGTTTAALAQMTAVQQLPYVEQYFVNTLGAKRPSAADYILATYGRVDAIGQPDSYVLDRKDSTDPKEAERYSENSALDAGGKGSITAGDLRASMNSTLAAAHGVRVPIPILLTPTPKPSSPIFLVALAAVSMVAAASYAASQLRSGVLS